jgi:hypothetical protein
MRTAGKEKRRKKEEKKRKEKKPEIKYNKAKVRGLQISSSILPDGRNQ